MPRYNTLSNLLDTSVNKYITADLVRGFIAVYRNDHKRSGIYNNAQLFINSGNKWGVNIVYLISHAVQETLWGTSDFALNRNNYYGYQAYDSNPNAAKKWASPEVGIDATVEFMKKQYFSPGGFAYTWATQRGNPPATIKGMAGIWWTSKTQADSIVWIMNAFMTYCEGRGVKIGKDVVLASVPKPIPQPVTPPAQNGSSYTVYKPIPGYTNAGNAAARVKSNSTVPAGTYAVFNRSNGMVNITRKAGSPGWWINPSQNPQPVRKVVSAEVPQELPSNVLTTPVNQTGVASLIDTPADPIAGPQLNNQQEEVTQEQHDKEISELREELQAQVNAANDRAHIAEGQAANAQEELDTYKTTVEKAQDKVDTDLRLKDVEIKNLKEKIRILSSEDLSHSQESTLAQKLYSLELDYERLSEEKSSLETDKTSLEEGLRLLQSALVREGVNIDELNKYVTAVKLVANNPEDVSKYAGDLFKHPLFFKFQQSVSTKTAQACAYLSASLLVGAPVALAFVDIFKTIPQSWTWQTIAGFTATSFGTLAALAMKMEKRNAPTIQDIKQENPSIVDVYSGKVEEVPALDVTN